MSTRLVRAGLSACILLLIALAVLAPALSASSAAGAPAQTLEPGYYDIGNPTLHDIWVDPFRGADSDSGDSRSHALRTLSEAWNRVPASAQLTGTGYRIMLTRGTYGAGAIPGWQEGRHGTRQFPVIIQSADGRGAAVLASGLNVYDCTFMYLMDISIVPDPGAECLHNEKCYDFLVRGVRMDGGHRAAQETLKVNQCQRYYVEDCDVSSSWNVPIDFMAVQYAHVIGSRVHDAGDWCMYFKGGSAYITAEGNELYDADNGGFSAGDGTGFEFMVPPWIHYDAYDIKFVNNIVHDTAGAAVGVSGGYDVLLAYNTFYRVGSRSHAIEIAHGTRGCDGDTAKCSSYRSQGGWGPNVQGDSYQQPIGDRNVYVYNNLLYNPAPFSSQWSHFSVEGPRTPAAGTNIPSPSVVDANLRIRGNMMWNGPSDLPLGLGGEGEGGQPSNATCNAAQVRADNGINGVQPQLQDPAGGDFAPRAGGNVFKSVTFEPPAFAGGDRPSPPSSPAGDLDNTVDRDYYGNARSAGGPPGAIAGPPASTIYFAEGYTGAGFAEYLCVGNPGAQAAHVSITYSFGDGTEQRQGLTVPAASRSTVNVNSVVGEGREVATRVTSDAPISVERPMYFDYQGMTGGHVTGGALASATSWYFAEGYTGPGFDDYLCVLNPGAEPSSLTLRFQTEERGEVVKSGLSVGARSRATFKVNDLLGPGQQCSLKLEATRPVVAERPMYFRYAGKGGHDWDGGHCVVGATALGTQYLFAEGTTRPGFEEYLTLQNPGSARMEVAATYQFAAGQGAPVVKSYAVAGGRRLTVYVPADVGAGKDVSVRLTSGSPFMAERPVYFSYGEGWDGGHCLIGAPLASDRWFFAEGYTGPGFDEWLCLWNPGSAPAGVRISYLTQEAGALPPRSVSIPAGTRLTIKVNESAGSGYQLSALLQGTAGSGFVAERPMYFDYYGRDGGHDM